jgi:hypothetical protein
MVMLLKKEHARSPDSEIEKCVDQLNMYIRGQVPFNFDELDNFELGETEPAIGIAASKSGSKSLSRTSSTVEVEDAGETGVL